MSILKGSINREKIIKAWQRDMDINTINCDELKKIYLFISSLVHVLTLLILTGVITIIYQILITIFLISLHIKTLELFQKISTSYKDALEVTWKLKKQERKPSPLIDYSPIFKARIPLSVLSRRARHLYSQRRSNMSSTLVPYFQPPLRTFSRVNQC